MPTAENKQLKYGLSILKLLEAAQFAKKVSLIHCRCHQNGNAEVIKENKADATAKRAALEPVTWQLPREGQIHPIITQSTVRKS